MDCWDIDILNEDQFVDWINIDILLVELLFVPYAFEYNSVFMVKQRHLSAAVWYKMMQ